MESDLTALYVVLTVIFYHFDSCPLDDTVDNVMNYLCHIPLEEFGQCLQASDMSEDSDKQLYRLTDGFSVASLKVLEYLIKSKLKKILRYSLYTLWCTCILINVQAYVIVVKQILHTCR